MIPNCGVILEWQCTNGVHGGSGYFGVRGNDVAMGHPSISSFSSAGQQVSKVFLGFKVCAPHERKACVTEP